MIDDIDVTEFVEVLEPALTHAVAALESAHDVGIRERELEEALERALQSGSGPLWTAVQRQWTVRPTGWKGRVGPVDLVALDAKQQPVALVEAKLGGSALWNRAWDLAKLALCSADGIAPYCALIAAARSGDWATRTRGAELFEPRHWELSGFLRRFARDFAFWRDDVANRPGCLPAQWHTIDLEPAGFSLAGERWEVRGVAVEALDPELLRVVYAPVVARRGRARGPSASRHPEALLITAGAGLGSRFEVRWDGRALEYQAELRGPEIRDRSAAVTPSDASWQAFLSELDALDVWAWSDRYEPLAMATDGYAWEVRIAFGGRSCDSSGYMAFPGDDPESESSATWDAFLLAVRDLLGGLPTF